MATLPLPGQGPRPSLGPTDPILAPDEVGYRKPSNMAKERALALLHTPDTCEREHCSCHLPKFFQPPNCELTGREAFVLAWHVFALDDSSDEELSFEAIGQRLGVSQTRVKQIYQRAAAKLRAHARVHYPPRPGTPEYEKRMADAEAYRLEHPEYAQNRALLDAMEEEGIAP